MDEICKRLADAVREAKTAYEFNPNSYTFSAMSASMIAQEKLMEIELIIRQRLAY